MPEQRILHAGLRERVTSAAQAAALIRPGDNRGHERLHRRRLSEGGAAGAGRAASRRRTPRGEAFRINLLTGASTAPELDGALAQGGRAWSCACRTSPIPTRASGSTPATLDYIDIHLSHVAQHVWFGFFGEIDIAVVEVAAILEDGSLMPSSSVGNNKTWLDQAQQGHPRGQPAGSRRSCEGMHDIYYGTALPPHRKPIPLTTPRRPHRRDLPALRPGQDRRGGARPTRPTATARSAPPDADSQRIAGHLIDFLAHEVKRGRLPANLLPLQSGVGNIPNAVLAGLASSGYRDLTAYTEVIQDGMLDLLQGGRAAHGLGTAFSLSPDGDRGVQPPTSTSTASASCCARRRSPTTRS